MNLFSKSSQSFQRLNPHIGLPGDKNSLAVNSASSNGIVVRQRGFKNKTEAEYAMILQAMKQRGEILRYEYQGITLRWQCGTDAKGRPVILRYTPDFVVFVQDLYEIDSETQKVKQIADSRRIKLIEIKGAFTKGKFERAIERFRHALTYWPEFRFEMHQKTKQGWRQIL